MTELKPRAPRREIDVPVELSFDHLQGSYFGTSSNLSSTGMLVLSKALQEPGATLSFESIPASGTGQVVWARPTENGEAWLGLKFLDLARGDDDLFSTSPPEGDRALWKEAWAGATGGGLSFREVLDHLVEKGFTLAEISSALGTPVEYLRRARSATRSAAHRDLPEDWKTQLAELTSGRGPALDELTRKLRGW